MCRESVRPLSHVPNYFPNTVDSGGAETAVSFATFPMLKGGRYPPQDCYPSASPSAGAPSSSAFCLICPARVEPGPLI